MAKQKADLQVRDLCFEDIEKFSLILDKINFNLEDFIKDKELVDMIKQDKKMDVKEIGAQVGLKMINYVLKNYHKASNEFYAWTGSLIGVKAEDMKKMPISTPVKIFQKLGETNDLRDFFNSVAG